MIFTMGDPLLGVTRFRVTDVIFFALQSILLSNLLDVLVTNYVRRHRTLIDGILQSINSYCLVVSCVAFQGSGVAFRSRYFLS
jgi:hypothetical protein